jgi:hypothetical protein
MGARRAIYALALMFISAVLGLFCACGAKARDESEVPYATSMLDGLLKGIAERDYALFSADLSDAMKKAICEAGYPDFLASMDGALGQYRSKAFLGVKKARSKDGLLDIVEYRAAYEKAAEVTITIYISDRDGRKKIEGFAAVPAKGSK